MLQSIRSRWQAIAMSTLTAFLLWISVARADEATASAAPETPQFPIASNPLLYTIAVPIISRLVAPAFSRTSSGPTAQALSATAGVFSVLAGLCMAFSQGSLAGFDVGRALQMLLGSAAVFASVKLHVEPAKR